MARKLHQKRTITTKKSEVGKRIKFALKQKRRKR